MMDIVNKKEEYLKFKDINGNPIKLYIQEVSHCLKISILNYKKSLYTKCILLFITASVDLVFLVFNIVSVNVIIAILCLVLIFMYTVCNITVEENIVIVKDIGVEVARIQVVGVKKEFFSQEQVQKCFINEVIFRNKVLFIMTILIRDLNKDTLVPLFTNILPQLELLKVVYNYMKHKL